MIRVPYGYGEQGAKRTSCDVQSGMELHARHARWACQTQVHGHRPNLVAEIRVLHDRAGADVEPLAKLLLPASVGHPPVLRVGLDVDEVAQAGRLVPPADLDEPRVRSRIIREHARALADMFATCFVCLLHILLIFMNIIQ